MRSLLFCMFSLLWCAHACSQESFEDKIAAIKELPLEEQMNRFREGITQSKNKPLELARFHHELGVAYFKQDDLFLAIEQTEKALQLRLAHESEAGEEVVFSAYNLGSFYHNLQHFEQAFAHFQLIVDRAPNSRIGYTLYRLGSMYQEVGEFKLSEQAFEGAIKEAPYPEDKAERAILLNDWADLYLKQDNTTAAQQAIPILKNAFQLFEEVAAGDNDYASYPVLTLNRLGMAYTYSHKFQEAFSTFDQALKYNERCCQDKDLQASIHTNQGIAHRRSGAAQKALEYHLKSLSLRANNTSDGQVQMNMARAHDNIATARMQLGEYEAGLQSVQSALSFALPEFSAKKPVDNPTLEMLKASPNKNSLLIYLQDKGDLWQQLALARHEAAYFDNAIATYQLCDQLIDLIRLDHLEKNTKLFWRDQARKMYQSAVKAAWIAERPEMAFYFSEKSRAVLLLDGLRELNAHSRLPAATQKELAQLAAKIQYLEKNIYEQKKGENPVMDGQLVLLRQTYRNLLDSIEQKYPEYYRQKYQSDFISLSVLQNSLAKQEVWVEYFLADEFSLALVIFPEAIRMVELAAPQELAPHINNLLANLKNYQQTFDPQPALALYQYLIAPLELEPQRKITLVPDGPLSLIPFEVLIAQTPDVTQDYDEWAFLLKTHQLNYAFSANSRFFEPGDKRQNNGRILAFAPMALLDPEYGIDASLELPETKFTIERLAEMLPTDILLGQRATRQVLNQAGPQAAVLHLATHAYVDHEQPEFSYFLVADPDPGKRRFYINELYNQEYQADLVVLSACETGAGKLFRGEGISSIGRTFAQNGCPNLAMSLWPVDEGATGKLLEIFYQKLESGMSKAEALYQAKREYLQQAGSVAGKHPFRWAGIIYYGADQPLQLKQSGWGKKQLVLGLLAIALLSFLLINLLHTGTPSDSAHCP